MSLLEVKDLRLTFEQPAPLPSFLAVQGASFTLEKGEMLALVGESGSGKSLTALACLGLQPEAARISGNINFAGEELVDAPQARLKAIRGKRIAMIFQEPMTALNPLHTISRQIEEMIQLHTQLTSQQRLARVLELLGQVGLAHFKDRLDAFPHELSGGERQRVMIAMAIANNPDILIADEPTTAVDVTVQLKILELLKALQAKLGMAILFITHDLTIVRRLADRVAVMSQGKLVEIGKVADVFAAPAHPYTQHLLVSEPKGIPLPLKNNNNTVISAQDLRVWFPIKKGFFGRVVGHIKAVNQLSITIPESYTLGVVGESGSGKTTLGFALLRLIKSQGRITFQGTDISSLKTNELRAFRQQMQPVFQDPFGSLNPRMTVRQIIGEGLEVHFPQLSENDRESRIDEILLEVGLSPDIKSRFAHEFSGGQRQRISIARAMVLHPKFVVLDEPTSALDLSVQAQILDLLKKLQEKWGLSYMFISHDLRVVRAIAHHIIVMYRGDIVEQGPAETIFANPQHDYTKALIKAAFMGDK